MKTFEHVSSGEIFCTNRELSVALPGVFVELSEFGDEPDVVWDEGFRAFMSTRIEDGTRKEFRWSDVHLTNNGLYRRQ